MPRPESQISGMAVATVINGTEKIEVTQIINGVPKTRAMPLALGDAALRAELSYVDAPGQGASLVGIEDPDGLFDATTVQDALIELKTNAASGNNDVQIVLRAMRDGAAVKIVCLGDSITYGQLDTGGQAVTPWPARLQSLLRQYYGNNLITVVNAGISGNTVQNMINRFTTDVRAEDPDLIIFNGGTNDSRPATAVSLTNYKGDVEQILALANPTPVIIWGITPRFKEQRSGDGEGVVDFYRQTLQKIANTRGIMYIDTFHALHNLYRSRAWAAGKMSSDGSHYTEDGYRYIGDFLFAKGFANDDLFMKPGQFKDARGQWLITEAADSTWGVADLQDADAVVITAATVRAYLFVEEWEECFLALHATMDCANSTDQTITVNNQSLPAGGDSQATIGLSPNLAGGATFYINDYAMPAVRLRPGINNIQLSTATSARISGFSVVKRGAAQYLPSYNQESNENRATQFWSAARYRVSTQAFDVLRPGILTVSNSATGFIEPYFLIVPDPITTTSRWRMRTTLFPGASFYLGQQSNDDVRYGYVYKVEFDGANCIVSVRDHVGAVRVAATVAKAVAAGGQDLVIDIKSGATGWTLWVGATLIFSDAIPLSIGPVFVSSSATKRSYWNPPIKKGPADSDTGTLVGETWQTFTDDKLHIVTDAGTEKTVTFA